MQDIIDFLLLIFTVYFIYLLLFYIIKRAVAVKKIRSLAKTSDAEVTFTRMPYSSYFRLSEDPDATVEIGEKIYLIRFINGKGSTMFLHFASDEYFVTFSKIRISVSGLLRIGARRSDITSSTSRRSVKRLPKLALPDKYIKKAELYGKKIVPVLIFTPAPNEVSYVTDNKTSIKVAFSGDEIYGTKIFTASTFITYADRERREEEYRRRHPYETKYTL